MSYYYPFGETVHPLVQQDRTPKKVFVLGVYASAVHARWKQGNKIICQALAVACKLCISPKYLTAVCKKNSGKTANEWITEQVLEDIRYYLRQTDLSIKQICDRLGFPNPSFFGKYVKDHFGMTPMEFRNYTLKK